MRLATIVLAPTCTIIAVISFSCTPKPELRLGDAERECPHNSRLPVVSALRRSELPRPYNPSLDFGDPFNSVTGSQQNVTEYNDCQRFLVTSPRSGDPFDSLFAIFASNQLGWLDSLLKAEGSERGSVSWTTTTPKGASRSIFISKDHALASALIKAEGDYGSLHIQRGFSCLFLYRRDAKWMARILWIARIGVDSLSTDCSAPVNPDTLEKSFPLLVHETVVNGFHDPADYPAVARWDFDDSGYRQIIGVRCAAAWCEIGPMDGFGSVPVPDNPEWTTAEKRVQRIKGWHDEQYLAMRGDGQHYYPSTVRARIVPDTQLGAMTPLIMTQALGIWHSWAKIELQEPNGELYGYNDKYSLHIGVNNVEFCFGPLRMCLGTEQLSNVSTSTCGDLQGWRFWGRVNGTSHFCVRFWNLPKNATNIGTVRCRWVPSDDGGWYWCPEGCCEMTEE